MRGATQIRTVRAWRLTNSCVATLARTKSDAGSDSSLGEGGGAFGRRRLGLVGHLRPEPEGHRRRRRRDQRVETLLEERVEVALDQGSDLLRLDVERVVVAGRQGVRPEHDPPLDLGAEAAAPRREVVAEGI